MNCKNCVNLLDDLFDGELREQLAAQLEAHIIVCVGCASEFAMIKREKEMFASYLFSVEPPTDLRAKFQQKLEAETAKKFVFIKPSFISSVWKTKLFGMPLLYPSTVCAVIIAAFGFLLFLSSTDEKKDFAQNNNNAEVETFNFVDSVKKTEVVALADIKKDDAANLKANKKTINAKFAETAKPTKIPVNSVTPERRRTIQQGISRGTNDLAKTSEAEQTQIKQIQTLEIEAARQMEKVEMLLRSFRNARFTEDGEQFDVSYERQQARRLLDVNTRLSRESENYGSLLTAQMLNKVEPYLLDIANLNAHPLPEDVLEIKDRVRNQNIIASLQIY